MTIFMPKGILEPDFTKSERKVRFGQLFFENNSLDEPEEFTPSSWQQYVTLF